MAKPIAGSWGWHAEHGLCYITSVARNHVTRAPISFDITEVGDNTTGQVSRHIVSAESVTILLHRDDLIALANQVRQAQGT